MDMIKKMSFWIAICFWLLLGILSLWLMINALYAFCEIRNFHWGMQMVAVFSGCVAFSNLGKAFILVKDYHQSSSLTIFVKDNISKLKERHSINRIDIQSYTLTFQDIKNEIPKRLLKRIDLKNLLAELQIWLLAFALFSYFFDCQIKDLGYLGWIFFFIVTFCKTKVSQSIRFLDNLIGELGIKKGFVRNTVIKEKFGFLVIQSVLPNESFECYTRFGFLLSTGVVGYIGKKRYLIDVLPRKAILVRQSNYFLIFKPVPYLPKPANGFSFYMSKFFSWLSPIK